MPFARKSARIRNGAVSPPTPKLPSVDRVIDQGRNLSNGPSGKVVPKGAADTEKRSISPSNLRKLNEFGAVELTDEEDTSSQSHKKQKLQHLPESEAVVATDTVAKTEPVEPSIPADVTLSPETNRTIVQSASGATGSDVRVCYECRTTETSTWRRDIKNNIICNKCGLRKRKDHHAPSRRLIERPRDRCPDEYSYVHTDLGVSDQMDGPVIDPRPPRPWVNHTERVSSRVPHDDSYSTTSTSPVLDRGTSDNPDYIDSHDQASIELRSLQQAPEIFQYSPRPQNPTPTRRRGPKKAIHPQVIEPKVCVSCRTEESPAWRRAADGSSLCNKCMLRQKRAEQKLANESTKPAVRRFEIQRAPVDLSAVLKLVPTDPSLAFQTNPHTSTAPYRTESQIVLKQFTHLNSSFASDNGFEPRSMTEDRPSSHPTTNHTNPEGNTNGVSTSESLDNEALRNSDHNIDPQLENDSVETMNDQAIDPELTKDDHILARSRSTSVSYHHPLETTRAAQEGQIPAPDAAHGSSTLRESLVPHGELDR